MEGSPIIREIEARVLLSSIKTPDPWFGIKYNMNAYRGCQHQCIYCDSRSECYGIEEFRDVLVKVNALDLLPRELASKRKKGLIGTGSMSDPYGPVEMTYGLTGKALEIIARYRFPVHIITKSDLILKDIDALAEISETRAVVSFTITTADDALAAKLEPGAPSPSRRLAAMEALASRGVTTGVTLMPVLPFIEDSPDSIAEIVTRAVSCGATHVIPAFGMTMRDRQRAYYYEKLDELFPGLRSQYEHAFGERYQCAARNQAALKATFEKLRARYGLATRVVPYEPGPHEEQLALL